MKKLIWSILIFLFTFSPLLVRAEEVKYGNLVTDESTIEEDFELLGLNINDWYKPTKYDYNKWYVIAMSEAYVDTTDYDIQTYFYFFNPNYSTWSSWPDFKYKINGIDKGEYWGSGLSYDIEHNIYKVKGFTYKFNEEATIEIYEIIDSYGEYKSDFKATANHSKLNGFGVELSFNSMLVLEEYKVVPVEVEQDKNFKNWWNSLFGNEPIAMTIYFYNFNFPDHIEYDDVNYAKFEYDVVTYQEDISDRKTILGQTTHLFYTNNEEIKRESNKIKEYKPGSDILYVNDNSMKLNFPTLYLGNRIDNKQFGDLQMDPYKNLFDYDCSILLGSTYKYEIGEFKCPICENKFLSSNCGYSYKYNQMEEIEILELHYKNDGILYKCQVAGDNLSPGDPGYNDPITPDNPNENLFDKIMEEIKGWFKGIWDNIINWFKDIYQKYKIPLLIIGGLIIGGLLFVILKNLVVLAKFLWTIVYGIGYIIFYPFILIYRAIDKKKNE